MGYSRLRCKRTGKVGFRTQQEVEIRLAEIRRNPLTPVIPDRWYVCEFCGMYHTTSQRLHVEIRDRE